MPLLKISLIGTMTSMRTKDIKIKFKAHSRFFDGLDGMGIEDLIRPLLHQHADFDFRIDYAAAEIRFIAM